MAILRHQQHCVEKSSEKVGKTEFGVQFRNRVTVLEIYIYI